MLIDPKEITLKNQKGESKTYVLSKFPAIQGREIIAKYPLSNMPKLGDYNTSEETMLKSMAFVGIKDNQGNILPLTTRELVNNHIDDFEVLLRLEWAMMEYNCSFFAKGLNSNFYASISHKAAPFIAQILTLLLQPSSKPEKPASMS